MLELDIITEVKKIIDTLIRFLREFVFVDLLLNTQNKISVTGIKYGVLKISEFSPKIKITK